MSNTQWFNGRFQTNWRIEQALKRLNVDIKQFKEYQDLISFLYNMELDHSSHGRLDDTGLDIDNCIAEIKKANEKKW